MTRRRKIITTVGSLPAFGILGTVSGQDRTFAGDYSPSDRDFHKIILNAHEQHGSDGVKRLFDEYELKHDTATATPQKSRDNENDFGTENRYSESNSGINLYLNEIPNRNDRVRLTVITDLDTRRNRPHGRKARYVDDSIGIGFNANHWSVVGEPHLNATEHTANWYSQSLKDGGLAGVVELQTSSGVIPSDGGSIALEAVLENLDGVPGTLWGSYDHTRA